MRKLNFLTIMLATFFVGLTVQVNAQGADSNATPTQPAGCTEDANFPAAGVPHSYEVSISGTGYNADGVYQWYVTQDETDLINGTVLTAADNYFTIGTGAGESTYNSTTSTTNKLGLTWTPESIANTTQPYFLVLKYTENNGTCDAMNMKVMKIEPLNKFKLAIDPVKDEAGTAFGATESATVCADDVDSAVYDATANKVTYTYGENTLYYKVTASGFVGDWKPQISLPALATTGGQKYESAQWSPDNGTTWYNFTGLAQNATAQELTSTDLATIPAPTTTGDTPTADYIYKVVIDNEKYETLADQTLSVATDGTYGGTNNDTLKDKTDDCSADEGNFADKDNYTVKARPTVTATSGGFIQKVE